MDEHEPARKRARTLTVRALDGEFAMSEANAHLLAQIAPAFRSAMECDSKVGLDVPTAFLVRAVTLARAFMEWDQQDGDVKRRQRVRVAKMIAAVRSCPFDEQHADTLGMGYTLPKMEERLSDEPRAEHEDARVTPQEMHRYFGAFPAGPMCFSLEVSALIVGLKRRTVGLVVSFDHHEIDASAYIGDVCITRGRNSPQGCSIQSATMALGLHAQATLRLSYFERDLTDDTAPAQQRWQLVDAPPTRVIESLRAQHDTLAAPGKCYDEVRLAGILLELATMISLLA
jgi:hypothetical protein